MTYITRAACNGIMPPQFSKTTIFNRDSLLASMMRSREMVRYLRAPFGFGKSLLACSYARLMFDFKGVYWFDGENPCFLRDLDAHTLLPDLLDATTVGDLVVFDDVPHLGAARRSHVWDVCAGLTKAGREVVVCATPTADPLAGHEAHCICIEANEMLYSEKDRESLRAQGISLRQDLPALHPVSKVPGLAMCGQESFCQFLRAHIEEMDNPAQSALSFCMLMLERGTVEELELILGIEVSTADITAKQIRSFMEVDEYNGEFAALGFPIKETLTAFSPYMATIANEAGADDSSELAMQLADVLLERGNAERVVQLLMNLCDPHRRSMWLTDWQELMLDRCALSAAESIYDSLRSERWRSKPELKAGSCVRRSLLDCSDGALDELSQVAAKVDYPLRERLLAASFAYVLTEDASLASELEQLFHAQGAPLKREAAGLEGAAKQQWVFWSRAAATNAKIDNIAKRLEAGKHGCLALACCVHRARLDGVDLGEIPQIQKQVKALLENHDGVPVAELALLRREVDSLGVELDMSQMSLMAAYHRCDLFEDDLEVQRTVYARSKAALAGAFSSFARAHVAFAGREARRHKKEAIEPLNMRLLGSFEVRLGSEFIDPKRFKRKKVRTLLSLLALESGHEFSCDNLAERLWGESTFLQARHSLYNSISILRKVLSLADGTCPYLVRSHGVISLKESLVQTDLGAVKELVKRLRYSDPDPDLYQHILEQIRELYKGDLLPSETNEPMLIAAREEWRNRVVNVLVHAAGKLASVGDSTVALQLAEQALVYNPHREDCYEHLMSLQARCGQRPAALGTWRRYRTYMVDELGLDPSKRIADLYERILNETL